MAHTADAASSCKPQQTRQRKEEGPRLPITRVQPPDQGKEEWSKVVGRKANGGKNKNIKGAKPASSAAASKAANVSGKGGKEKISSQTSGGKSNNANLKRSKTKTRPKIRTPKTAAVVITPTAEGISRAEVMAEARRKIKQEEMGITYVRPRIAVTGAIILEIPGENSSGRADQLAERLRRELQDKPVRITRPVKAAEIRISGLDESVSKEELMAAIANVGNCPIDEVKIGDIRRSTNGLGSVWARCPATVAKAAVTAGRIMVGWVSARIEALPPRPMHCYKCLESGHTRAKCTAPSSRGDSCYR